MPDTGADIAARITALDALLDRLIADGIIQQASLEEIRSWRDAFVAPLANVATPRNLEPAIFDALPPAEKDRQSSRLKTIEAAASKCVPTDPKSVMYGSFASNSDVL